MVTQKPQDGRLNGHFASEMQRFNDGCCFGNGQWNLNFSFLSVTLKYCICGARFQCWQIPFYSLAISLSAFRMPLVVFPVPCSLFSRLYVLCSKTFSSGPPKFPSSPVSLFPRLLLHLIAVFFRDFHHFFASCSLLTLILLSALALVPAPRFNGF